MTRLIELPQAFEEIAAAQAQNNGKSVEEYLPELIANALVQQLHPAKQGAESQEMGFETRAARIQRFRQWAESNGHSTPHLPDEAISREAMYTDA